MATFFDSMACGAGEFLRRMLDPRVTYIPGEHKVWRVWWALFTAGILTFGVLGVVAMIAVWSDKKFLKQMALATLYINIPFVLWAALEANSIASVLDLVLFGLVALASGGLGILIGFGIAAYAQRKIDIADGAMLDEGKP